LNKIPQTQTDSPPGDFTPLGLAIHRQQDRRNLTDAELLKCIQWMDQRKERGGDRGNQYTGGKAQSCALPKSADQTAQTLGISARKVERVRTVMDHGDANNNLRRIFL
jgi:hypothetical protein